MISGQLQEILDHLSLLWFEISLILGSLLVLIAGLIKKNILITKLLFVITLLVALLNIDIRSEEMIILTKFLSFDSLTDILKLVFAVLSVWIVFFHSVQERSSEFFFLILAVIAGSTFMLTSNHLLGVYLAVELTSLASYLITNFNFKKRSFEAGMKYLLFGGVSSAIGLYGASLIYGFTGTLTISEMDFASFANPSLLNFGIVAFIGSILFKVSLVPFHIWTPAAYEETPTEALPILSTLPKIGALMVLHRFLLVADFFSTNWIYIFIGLIGISSIVIGTLGALRQQSAKRIIAYGAIAQSGFLLAPLLIPGEIGLQAFVWYSIVYGLMNLAAFYLIGFFESKSILEISQYAGLGKSETYLGGLFVLTLIALIGLPPTIGFTAKFFVFSAMWSWFQETSDWWVLTYLIIAILSVVISLVFYLKIPFYFFLKDSVEQETISIESTFYERLFATILTGALLWLFFSPNMLNKIVENINFIVW